MLTPDILNERAASTLPGYLGIRIVSVEARQVRSELTVRPELMAPNGFLHAGSIIALADTSAGDGCLANLPAGATGFTTVELQPNHVGTACDGTVDCVASAVHRGGPRRCGTPR